MRTIAALIVFLLSVPAVFAQNSMDHGTRGGGETVTINGIPELRDLVDKTNCFWKTGKEMRKSFQYLDIILQKVAVLDWYFAAELSEEINYLSYCETEQLVKINTEDPSWGRMHNRLAIATEQAAIRINSDVYIDMKKVSKLSPRSQALLLIHEALHSYLSWYSENRNQKLRSFTGIIDKVESGIVSDRRSFHLQMLQNEILFPQTVASLTSFKEQVLFLIANAEGKIAYLAKEKNVDAFLKKLATVPQDKLYGPHIVSMNYIPTFQELIRRECENENTEILIKLLTSEYTFDLVVGACLEVVDLSDSSSVAEIIRESVMKGNYFKNTFEKLSKNQLSSQGGKIFTESGLRLISNRPESESIRLINVEAMTSEAFDSNLQMKGLAKVFAHLLMKEGMDYLRSSVLNQPGFKASFDINLRLADVRILPVSIEQEKGLAQRALPLLHQHFWDQFLNEVEESSNTEMKKTLLDELNLLNLGYRI